MSLGQFQESSQIGVFYSRHHYYDPGSTLIHPLPPLPLPPG